MSGGTLTVPQHLRRSVGRKLPLRTGRVTAPRVLHVEEVLERLRAGHTLGAYIRKPNAPGWVNALPGEDAPNLSVPARIVALLRAEKRVVTLWCGHHTMKMRINDPHGEQHVTRPGRTDTP